MHRSSAGFRLLRSPIFKDEKMMIRNIKMMSLCMALTWLLSFGSAVADVLETEANPLVLRFAVLGDAEPKPKPEFPGVKGAVSDINALALAGRVDFVVGVGDIAHKATLVQYENVTPVLQDLSVPFYPIMGNEEHNGFAETFLEFANRWNEDRASIDSVRYVVETELVALVLASPDHGRDFDQAGVDWMLEEIRRLAPKPVFLVVHAAQVGAYPENPDKGVENPGFLEVVAEPNLTAVISGDLHMDMDRTEHSKKIGDVHYLHIPALERTKIPDDSRHTAMFRVFSIYQNGAVQVGTYQVGAPDPLTRHAYSFALPAS
ncbi:MAG: metallophosphoesterase [Wenzhouxiangella sp.]|nr:metallophosphoesterase [Wenzhouxiangella sp.]